MVRERFTGSTPDGSVLAVLTESLAVLKETRDAVIQRPRWSGTQGMDEVIIRRLLVATADIPVQGPDVLVPDGWVVTIRQRHHTGNPKGYIAFSEGAVRVTGQRIEMEDNDSITVQISNLKLVWASADTASTAFELIVER